ncbi:MAG: hypothetical protein HQ509_02815 [Candidatus Marinimicrobia bacterium]|nr:hypothetical protein [Candidatus Neomarinimicrobiota bacterium]
MHCSSCPQSGLRRTQTNIVQGAIYGFPVSGHIAKVSIMSVKFQNNILTGGTFGAEGRMLFVYITQKVRNNTKFQ